MPSEDKAGDFFRALLEARVAGALLDPVFKPSSEFESGAARWAERYGGRLLQGARKRYAEEVAKLSAKAADEGWTKQQFADHIHGPDFAPYQRDRVARTESAFALNVGEADAWESRGIEWVRILDGTFSDEKCRRANGQVWSIARYQANPIAHPNCERDSVALPGYVPDGSEITDLVEVDPDERIAA